MSHWLIKSAVQRAFSFLPQSHWWNELLQKNITKSVELTPQRFELRLRDAQRHLNETFRIQLPAARAVYGVGTGNGAGIRWCRSHYIFVEQPRSGRLTSFHTYGPNESGALSRFYRI